MGLLKGFLKIAILAVLWLLCAKTAIAEEPPEIVWAHASVSATGEHPDRLSDMEAAAVLTEAVDEKLHALSAAGELPFLLKENDDFAFEEDYSEEASVTLIPLIMDDHAFKSEYVIEDKTFYKALIMTQIDMAFCYYPGSGEELRVLGVVPIAGYSSMGDSGEYAAPIPIEDMKAQFRQNIRALVRAKLDFPDRKYLKKMDVKLLTPDTYQVTDVEVTSEAARNFYGDRLPLAKALIASAFTSRYAAEHPKKVVLPSLLSGAWKEDAAKHTYQLSLGDTGKAIVMEEAGNSLVLDLSRVASFDIPLERDGGVYDRTGYVADLSIVGTEQKETAMVRRTELDDHNENVARHDGVSIMAELLTAVAQKLAEEAD